MALIIPDDAYVDEAWADGFHEKRVTASTWELLEDEEKAQRLITASDYLDFSYRYLGKKADENQPRQFPRSGSTVIPRELQMACALLAIEDGLFENPETEDKVTKIGPLQFEKFDIDTEAPRFSFIDNLLKGLIAGDDIQSFTRMARS